MIKTSVILCVFINVPALAGTTPVCEVAAKRGGLNEFVVQADPDPNGNRIVIADVDGDGSGDELKWFAPGSGSISPADNSTLILTLTSNRRSFTLEQQRLHVVKFESSYYVVTTRIDSLIGPWQREVFAITKEGMTKICSFSGKGQAP